MTYVLTAATLVIKDVRGLLLVQCFSGGKSATHDRIQMGSTIMSAGSDYNAGIQQVEGVLVKKMSYQLKPVDLSVATFYHLQL